MNQLELAPLFQHHMVLQREKPITVWGRGPEDAMVTVRLDGVSASAVIREHRWSCVLPPHGPAEGLTLIVEMDIPGFPVTTVKDVAVGDVWLAGGQSNMEYFLRYDSHWEEIRRQPLNRQIRMFNVPRLCFEGQQKDVSDSGYWFGQGEKAWETFSAPGYCFARELQPVLGVPVGIIGCNWGGTPACAWMDPEYLKEEPLNRVIEEYEEAFRGCDLSKLRRETLRGYAQEDSPEHGEQWKAVMYGLNDEEQRQWKKDHAWDAVAPLGPWHAYRPGGLYHQMLEQVIPYALKGVIWYQGESDSGHPDLYDGLMETLIRCWREKWKDDFPFLMVQLAPFHHWLDCTGENYAEIRRRQEMVAARVPNVWTVSIMDLGMYEDIHPKRKKEVGERLTLLARGCVYGEDILCRSPELASGEVSGNTITLKLVYTGAGLQWAGEKPDAFRVTVDGQEVKDYQVTLQGDSICIAMPGAIQKECVVSFAEEDYVEVNLFNEAGLPVKPFTWKYRAE
ncbi:MAG: sialate O-acetylesterase [Lachnospiraceae bacterium]|nr:sialate O-acetylesterase [Lachnospiraceae bacterium]